MKLFSEKEAVTPNRAAEPTKATSGAPGGSVTGTQGAHAPLIFAFTDRGGHRPDNQDAVVCRALTARSKKASFSVSSLFRTQSPAPLSADREIVLCAVCDGIGGLERGDLASGIVAASLERFADSLTSWLDPATVSQEDTDILFSHFTDAVEHANTTLYETAQQYGLRCGTTFSGFLAVGSRYLILHAGDSRIYRFRPCDTKGIRLLSLTEDECVWRKTEKNGVPVVRSYLENFVGRAEALSFRSYRGILAAGDMLLCTTDGFYHNLTEEDVGMLYCETAAGNGQSLADCAKEMILRGEHDNLSAVLYTYHTPIPAALWDSRAEIPSEEERTLL